MSAVAASRTLIHVGSTPSREPAYADARKDARTDTRAHTRTDARGCYNP